MTWSKTGVRLLGAVVFGLVGQFGMAQSPAKTLTHKPVPASVVAKLPGAIQSKLGLPQAKMDSARSKSVVDRLSANSHAFVENKGQWNSAVRFRARSEGLEAWLTKSGITFDFFKHAERNGKKGYLGQVVKMDFVGTDGASSAVGVGPIGSKDRFLLKKKAGAGVASLYRGVLSKDLYPGVDLKTYYSGKKVRYDLIVNPGANPDSIAMSFKGADSVLAQGSKLVLGTQLGKIAQGDLFAYQISDGKKVQVPASFEMKDGKVGFKVGNFDHSKSLVIDPVIYGSYFGGNASWDEIHGIVADTTGGVYVTGTTQSSDFPQTAGPYFTTLKGITNGFLTRFEGDAYNVDYSVLFGGSNTDNPEYIQLDPYGNIWIAGSTTSPDFPGNTKPSSQGNPDIFVIRFQKSTSLILDPVTNPATLMIGGTGSELLQGFSIVPVPNAPASGPTTFLLGGVPDQAVPEVPGAFDGQTAFLVSYTFNDGESGFSQNPALCFYVGDNSSFPVTLSGLTTDSSGAAYITGSVGVSGTTIATNVANPVFYTTAGVFASGGNPANGQLLQGVDLFIRKYTSSGGLPVASGLLGGADDEVPGGLDFNPDGTTYVSGSCIAVDAQDNVYIVGVSTSFDYPRSRGSYGETWADGLPHVVLTKVSSDFTQILYSTNLRDTFLGGDILPSGVAVDGFGNAYVTGNLFPAQLIFPSMKPDPDAPTGYLTGPPVIQTGAAGSDPPLSTTWTFPAIPQIGGLGCYLNVINPTGSALVYGTYLSGTLDTKVYGPYVDAFSDLWVFGWTAGVRTYAVLGANGFAPNPPYLDFSSLPATMITSKAFKTNDQADQVQLVEWAFWDPGDPFNPGILDIGESRDGWLTKIRVGRPIISSVNLGQSTVPGGLGYQTTVSVSLSGPAPAQGAQVVLSIDNASAASFASSGSLGTLNITIPAGQTTSATVPIFSLPVVGPVPVNIKGTYDGNYIVSALNVVPWLQNLSLNPTGVVGGNNVTGTITLSFPAPAGGVPVTVTSASSLLTFPANNLVTVPAGQSTVTFQITTGGVDSITTVTAAAAVLGVTKTATLELDATSLLSITVLPTSISTLGTLSGTVTLTGTPGTQFPGVTLVVTDLASNPLAGYVVTPVSLAISDFDPVTHKGTFTITDTVYEPTQVSRLAVASMSAVSGTNYTSQSVSTPFTVDPSALLTLTIDNLAPNPGDTINATVTLATQADQGGAIVNLTSDTPSLIPIPTSANPVVVPAGGTTGTVALPVTAVAVLQATPVNITATRGSVTSVVQVIVQPSTGILSLTDNNGNPVTAVLGGSSVTATVTLTAAAPEGGLTVSLIGMPTGIASIDGATSVTIPAGQTSVSFTLDLAQVQTATTVNISVQIGGENGITSNVVSLTVNPSGLQSISFIPAGVRGHKTAVCKVVLTGPAPAGGLVITLVPSNTSLFPSNKLITVPAGQTVGIATFMAPTVSRPLAVTWTATDANGNLASAVLTVLR